MVLRTRSPLCIVSETERQRSRNFEQRNRNSMLSKIEFASARRPPQGAREDIPKGNTIMLPTRRASTRSEVLAGTRSETLKNSVSGSNLLCNSIFRSGILRDHGEHNSHVLLQHRSAERARMQRYHRAPYVSFGIRRRPQIVIIGSSVGNSTCPDCQRIFA